MTAPMKKDRVTDERARMARGPRTIAEPGEARALKALVEGSAHILPQARRGRGVAQNESGRFEAEKRVRIDDGWTGTDGPEALATTITRDMSRSVIARNNSPDLNFDRSINPYRGCEHGCTYCYARPSHAFLGLSPGLDFESQIFIKPDAAQLLKKELGAKSYKPRTLALGTNTDPYQPVEKRFEITRAILEVLNDHNHPVAIVTKSALVARDADILGDMAARNLAKVALSITTLDRALARSMEPRAATPAKRLAAVTALSEAGVPVHVMTSPVIPGLNDMELEALLTAAAGAGAQSASYILLRLPLEVRDLFRDWLEEAVPDRADKIMSLIRQMRDGKDYDARFFERMKGSGPYADLIARRFRLAARRAGLDLSAPPLRTDLFVSPRAPSSQLTLFGEEETRPNALRA